MIAKFDCGIFKENNELYFLVIYNDTQSKMEEFLKVQMGFNQAHGVDGFDSIKIYDQFNGEFFEYIKGLKWEVINPSVINIYGEKFTIEFPVNAKQCLNFKRDDLPSLVQETEKKFVAFGSTLRDEDKAVYISELTYN